jgi:hypothetical protein
LTTGELFVRKTIAISNHKKHKSDGSNYLMRRSLIYTEDWKQKKD